MAYASLYGQREKVLGLSGMTAPGDRRVSRAGPLWTTIKIAFALLVLAVLDYGFQWWKNERDMRMTSQEVREELKNLEANPQMVARRKQVQRQLAMHRTPRPCPRPTPSSPTPPNWPSPSSTTRKRWLLPIVVAKGGGVFAARIRKLALEHGVPILERKPLAQALYREVEINQPIPQARFAAVAEVLAYVYQLKGKKIPGSELAAA